MTQAINRYIDAAILKPGITPAEAEADIRAMLACNVYSVCVRPADITMAVRLCEGTTTAVGTVLSFPHGCGHPTVKAREAETYIALGVSEIDMVVNYGLVRAADWEGVQTDIAAVVNVARPRETLVKVILETSELEMNAIAGATEAAIAAGADYVKTSTGFASGGASESAVQTMLDTAQERIKVKASGGIRERATAEKYVTMGCQRLGIGAAATPTICNPDAGSARDNGQY